MLLLSRRASPRSSRTAAGSGPTPALMCFSELYESVCMCACETDSSRWKPVGVLDACLCFQTFESFTVYWKGPTMSMYVSVSLFGPIMENPAKTSF